ncbi:MAG: restriction endonuclease subunit S [Chloroflexota bacterium]
MTNWSERTLDELGYVSRGRSRNRPRDAEHLYGGDYPFIQTGDIKHSNLYITEYSQTYSEAGLEQSRLWKAGTLCITIAANIADTAILSFDACFPDSVIGFIADEDKADARFIKYLFDALLQKQFQQFSQGAAQDNLSQEKLLSLKFPIPDLKIQHRIADILSSYDDLIENNRRRIDLLAQSARLLYNEWFVFLRFPGHEHVKVKDGLPQGWVEKPLGEIFEFKHGKAINVADEGDFPIYGSNGIIGKTNEVRCENAIIIGRVGAYCGSINYCLTRFSASDNTIIASPLLSSGFGENFAYRLLTNLDLRRFASGAAQPLLTQSILNKLNTLVPPSSLCLEYESVASNLFSLQTVLEKENTNLRQARDLLLPRLMNGEIPV